MPGAPGNVVATAGDGQATVTWTPPQSDGMAPIQYYFVQSTPGGFHATVSGSVYSASVTGLTDGQAYTFTVTATNAVGTGPASQPSAAVTPTRFPGATAPAAPQDVVATTTTGGQATITWAAPSSDGGEAITGYTVPSDPSGFTATVGGSMYSATVNGLTDGTSYTFTVAATNAVGTGPASAASNAVTPLGYTAGSTVPSEPLDVVARAGDGQATVTWSAPASEGGSAILDYIVIPSSGPAVTTSGPTTSLTVAGLSDGATYSFTVRARNAVGDSPSSAPSNDVVPGAGVAAPVVSGLSPATGPAMGGTLVTVSGSGFTPAASVAFGGSAAVRTVYVSSSSLEAVAPPGTGTVDVVVTTSAGPSVTGPADQFVYQAGLAVTRTLFPGWNTLSLPFQVANPDLQSLLGGGASSVLAAYAYSGGQWRALSVRDPDALQAPMTGLFLYIGGSAPVTATLVPAGTQSSSALPPEPGIPPTHALSRGWNLVGPSAASGAESYGAFLSGVDASAVPLLIDPNGAMTPVPDPAEETSGTVRNGYAYWVYATDSQQTLIGTIPADGSGSSR